MSARELRALPSKPRSETAVLPEESTKQDADPAERCEKTTSGWAEVVAIPALDS